jgi:hypothetical protein
MKCKIKPITDCGVEWSVGGLGQGNSKFLNFCQARKIGPLLPILPSLIDFN